MAKPELEQRKREARDAARVEERNVRQRRLNEQARAIEAAESKVLELEDASYFNLPMLEKLNRRHGAAVSGVKERLKWRHIKGGMWAKFKDLEGLYDSFDFGFSPVTRLEVFRVVSFDDLAPMDRLTLGIPMPVRPGVQGGYVENPHMVRRFDNAWAAVDRSSAFYAEGYPLLDLPDFLRASVWAAVDGDPSKRPVLTIEDACPFEVVYDRVENRVLSVRTLKRQPKPRRGKAKAADAESKEAA